MNKLVSVIVPVYNREEFILECLKSVEQQIYRPIELIVVDDGSTDSSISIINKFIKIYNVKELFEVKLLKQKNSGAPNARNNGFLASNGFYVQFLDSDDLILPNKIQDQICVLDKDKNLDFVYSKAQYIDDKNNRLDKYWGRELTQDSRDYFYFSYQTMCALYKSSTIKKFGLWDEELSINQDWEFSVRYILKGAKSYFINEVNSLFRKHSIGNIGFSDRTQSKIKGKFLATKKIYLEIIKQNKRDNFVKKVFRKRFIYILMVTSLNGSISEVLAIKKFILDMNILSPLHAKFFSTPAISKLILFIYDKKHI